MRLRPGGASCNPTARNARVQDAKSWRVTRSVTRHSYIQPAGKLAATAVPTSTTRVGTNRIRCVRLGRASRTDRARILAGRLRAHASAVPLIGLAGHACCATRCRSALLGAVQTRSSNRLARITCTGTRLRRTGAGRHGDPACGQQSCNAQKAQGSLHKCLPWLSIRATETRTRPTRCRPHDNWIIPQLLHEPASRPRRSVAFRTGPSCARTILSRACDQSGRGLACRCST